MNAILAQIYGTGLNKTASDTTTEQPEGGELDFDNMSAAQLIAGLEDGSIVFNDTEPEKTATENVDLSKMSGAELLEMLKAQDGNDTIEKMASDGSLDYFDAAGRIMAHAYADELSKVASPDEIEVDLNAISGDQLMDLIEQGYEIVDDTEKTAGRVANLGAAIADRVGFLGRKRGAAGAGAAKNMRELAFKKFRAKNPNMPASEAKQWGDASSYNAQVRAKRMRENVFNRNVGRGAVGAGVAAGAAGTAAGAAGISKMRKKKDEDK